MSIRKGAKVRQKQPAPIEGIVVDKQFNADDDAFKYIVQTADGTEKSFNEGELEVLPEGDQA